ncbi:Ribonuclease 3 [Candidatus Xenohaliotis californiensis]|uniref:Ribonuclease 3 n=1 Tax=Candidatus Xenohaliotis californiensis TaxID=84677 RepID=A0ABM9N798_9RICK|nr:Ribonuclease 3 [Candidatus Xenohaliotis californiensis]
MNTKTSQYIYEILQYTFKDHKLLNHAMLHPSHAMYNVSAKFNYEKLELLGDAVLSLVITQQLLEKFPLENEGDLAKRKAYLVSGDTIAAIARQKKLGKIISMSPTEQENHGQNTTHNLENALEAIIGAIYIDGGLPKAENIVKKLWQPYIIKDAIPPQNPKSILQEIAQASKQDLTYAIIKTGPSHKPIFTARATLNISADGTASSKQKAEVKAAQNILSLINETITKYSKK